MSLEYSFAVSGACWLKHGHHCHFQKLLADLERCQALKPILSHAPTLSPLTQIIQMPLLQPGIVVFSSLQIHFVD